MFRCAALMSSIRRCHRCDKLRMAPYPKEPATAMRVIFVFENRMKKNVRLRYLGPFRIASLSLLKSHAAVGIYSYARLDNNYYL